VFRHLVLARVIEPVSKLDSIRVLEEAGVAPASYRTIERRLPAYAKEAWRQRLSAACAAHARLGPASLVLYDVSTLYMVPADGLCVRGQPGRDEDDAAGHREVHGRPPVARCHRGRGRRDDLRREHEGHRGGRAVVHPGDESARRPLRHRRLAAGAPGRGDPHGHVFTQPWPAGPKDRRRDQVIYYQYRADRARRTLHGIDEQVAKAAKAVAGLAPVKRNRFISLDGAVKSVNRELEEKARTLAGIKGCKTNLAATPDGEPVTADFVISSYHELWNIEKSFRMSKSDLQARPIYHRKRDSIEAHLTIVFAALAVSRWIESQTGWSIRKFVKTARRYREIKIQAGHQTITAGDPLPDDLRQALDAIAS
jgi:hypothetical protein